MRSARRPGTPPDAAAVVEIPGRWRHRHVSAGGSRFHLVEAGPTDGPLVLFLHGFPQFWWAWRHQLVTLAAAGHRVAAMDLRGFGGSDKPPRGYDTFTLAADVDGVIRSLGAQDAVLVGHSWGGWIAWAMPTLHPRTCRAIAVVGTAHPLRTMLAAIDPRQARGLQRTVFFQVPMAPERRIADGDLVEQVLREWSATPGWPDAQSVDRYREAMRIPASAHCSMEYYRWAMRSRVRADGRRFTAALRRRVAVPVLQLHGRHDPHIPLRHALGSQQWVSGPYEWHALDGGHFLAEESPDAVNVLLGDWLARL